MSDLEGRKSGPSCPGSFQVDTDALDEAVRRFPVLLHYGAKDFVPERYQGYVCAEYRLVLKEREKQRGQ